LNKGRFYDIVSLWKGKIRIKDSLALGNIMKDIIRQLIIDFNEFEIPKPTTREAYAIPSLPDSVRKAFVYIGMRRSGKTWVMYDFMHRLMAGGIAKNQILYLDFTDDRLEAMTANDLQYILDVYFELNPELINNERIYFFFDEIQEIEGFDRFIRRLLDKEKMQIYITGSSARMLSKEISTVLRGRTIEQQVFPFDFFEYLENKNLKITKPYSSKDKYRLHSLLNEYLHVGGFPEVSHMEQLQRIEVLQGYVNSVVYKDIVERHEIKNIYAVRSFIHHCVKNPATQITINKIYNRFKSQGISVSKDLLYECFGYFEDSFCIFSVPLLTPSIERQQINPKKIYPVDTGLITAYSFSSNLNVSAMLETIVFLTLIRTYSKIFYYFTNKGGLEIDFVVLNSEDKPVLIQVCVDLNYNDTAQREFAALHQAMEELNTNKGYIVTMDTQRSMSIIPGTTVEVVSLLSFLHMDPDFLYKMAR
jgi:predicted AAA+ superfamily ATPase